ncbi:YceI family protein [Ilumatobacter sp.]|uniref:YceI family protein n=1 Tax=Ilumatobacter sp. TaxID=1967498 RepID=UPI003B51AE10
MSTTETTVTTPAAGTYNIDPTHSRIGFAVRHAMISKVRGSFNEFAGSGHFDLNDPSSIELSLEIDVASLDTRNADRDGHVLSADFLDAEQFPKITFASTSVRRNGDDFTVVGDLTVKDITRPVEIEFEYGGAATDLYGMKRIGFDGSTTISREEFGVTFNAPLETGGVIVGDKVTLEFEVSAVLADQA